MGLQRKVLGKKKNMGGGRQQSGLKLKKFKQNRLELGEDLGRSPEK